MRPGARLSWLARQPLRHRREGFRPQPYEQLTKTYRAIGHEDDARTISVAKRTAFRRSHLFRLWNGAFAWSKLWLLPLRAVQTAWEMIAWLLIGLVAREGYSWMRPAALVVAAWLGCAWVYGEAARQGAFAPSNPVVYTQPDLASACRDNWASCRKLPPEHPAFDSLVFSADVILPTVDFGQERVWSARDDKPVSLDLPMLGALRLGPQAIGLLVNIEVVLGWLGFGLLIAVVSGLLKRE